MLIKAAQAAIPTTLQVGLHAGSQFGLHTGLIRLDIFSFRYRFVLRYWLEPDSYMGTLKGAGQIHSQKIFN